MKLLPRRPVARGIVFGVADAENNATRDRPGGTAAASLTRRVHIYCLKNSKYSSNPPWSRGIASGS